ncbi:bacteriocin immunity protein [Lacticaseibacillus hulanensis]|jgi:hypothetical protein|uniref:bacteriocin immunity protein n=1 Tax=Lacticaseibacillus hulanensis TaxID=2493111 RepID=UPI000FD71DD1|nr:bacteriocin immunity protein [Lacticaseibacillus hulanensis]
MKRLDRNEFRNQLVELIVDPETTDTEKKVLREVKQELDKDVNDDRVLLTLHSGLNPLALRRELSPKVGQMYNEMAQIQTGISGSKINPIF